MTFTDWLAARRAELDHLFDSRLTAPAGGDPGRLIESMRYSLLAPGKRIRPLLALAAAETVAPVSDDVRLACAAVELVLRHAQPQQQRVVVPQQRPQPQMRRESAPVRSQPAPPVRQQQAPRAQPQPRPAAPPRAQPQQQQRQAKPQKPDRPVQSQPAPSGGKGKGKGKP